MRGTITHLAVRLFAKRLSDLEQLKALLFKWQILAQSCVRGSSNKCPVLDYIVHLNLVVLILKPDIRLPDLSHVDSARHSVLHTDFGHSLVFNRYRLAEGNLIQPPPSPICPERRLRRNNILQ